jgi:hypothetical protein
VWLRNRSPVRRAQRHSRMPGRVATIPPSPPEKQKRVLVALFCSSRRARLRTSDPDRPAQPRSDQLAGSPHSYKDEQENPAGLTAGLTVWSACLMRRSA